jgi:uncharacterized protein (DUF305 family)
MKKHMVALTAAVGLAVAGCGSDEPTARAVPGNATDRAFVAAMIPHHESAVKMASVAQGRGETMFVKELAGDIIRAQTDEIVLMRKQDAGLAKAGVKAGKLSVPAHMLGMDQDAAMLQSARPFDPAFIKMMVPHHEGAVEMAREELDKGQDPELKQLAQNIVESQQREIDQMRQHLKSAADAGGSGGHSGHTG